MREVEILRLTDAGGALVGWFDVSVRGALGDVRVRHSQREPMLDRWRLHISPNYTGSSACSHQLSAKLWQPMGRWRCGVASRLRTSRVGGGWAR
jgi:hypothetical protein